VIASTTRRITCGGLPRRAAQGFAIALSDAVDTAIQRKLLEGRLTVERAAESLEVLFAAPRYLSNRDIQKWRAGLGDGVIAVVAQMAHLLANPMVRSRSLADKLHPRVTRLSDVLSDERGRVKARNADFIGQELATHKAFFDSVETTPLTIEQRVASIVSEDRNLLVAAAGSGKTSTVVGKVGYGLLTRQFMARDYLVLAFNNDAAKELSERINRQLGSLLTRGEEIRATTFHALGLDVIAHAEGRKPSVANFVAGNEVTDSSLMDQLILELMSEDRQFASDWLVFRALYSKPARDPAHFGSRSEWDQYIREHGDYKNGQRGFLTLQGELVKSQGELAIANWFYAQGMPYEYERPYEHDTATILRRQYRPDFYLPDIKAYLEHYALDEKGNAPAAFGEEYARSIEWKRQLHEERGTTLITTTFADFISGRLFPKLTEELNTRGQKFSPVPDDVLLKRLEGRQKTDYGGLLRTFIKHSKSNEVDQATLLRRADGNPQPHRARMFVSLFWKLMNVYERRLQRAGEIDFEDMIVKAARHLSADRYRHPYKAILVDEFQDVSQARARMLKGLLDQNPDCTMFAVGDDWQSIYRFAGADIDVFTNFPKHFGVTETNYLTQTFRSNRGITEVASSFIQKNPGQLKKRVEARDDRAEGVVVIRRHDGSAGLEQECEASLEEINRGPGRRMSEAAVFILGRYRHQRPTALDRWQKQFAGSLDISFRTIHSSKGLQADYVIVLGLSAGRYAFPSETTDDPLFQLVMPVPEDYDSAEERRLFYVAATRAKHGVYLLGSSGNPSAFLTELIEDDALRDHLRFEQVSEVELETCPKCGRGKLRRRNGRFGEFMGCSNYPICRFTRDGVA
jgi:DNA helicase-4